MGATASYVCFGCRRSIKGATTCPECKQSTIRAGRDFKAPRREALSQWRKAELILTKGIGFDSSMACGQAHRVPRPRTLAEAKRWEIEDYESTPFTSEMLRNRLDPVPFRARKLLAKRSS